MIIKRKLGYIKRDELNVVYHGSQKNELKRMTKAFHSNCRHIKEKFLGCGGVVDQINHKVTIFQGSGKNNV